VSVLDPVSGGDARGIPAPARRGGRELLYAAVAIAGATALWAVASSQAGRLPAAASLVGHGVGIVGSVLMLMTATLYSLRKLRTDARWGATSGWLSFHMVTGLVGPYLVLLHSALRFNGLAGLTMLLTVVVVASGLVGRFLYTRIPRAPGPAPTGRRRAFAMWHLVHLSLTWALFAAATVHVVAALYYATLAP
jgi:hypothetical protein